MSEQEKAKELVHKYTQEVFAGPYKATDFSNICAKECAIICVNEIINELKITVFNYDMNDHFGKTSPSETTIPYWNRVKDEINKL